MDQYYKEKEPWISTYTGGKFDWTDPTFNWEDIIHALPHICRFNGQCKEFYSVAEHSALVQDIMEWMGVDGKEGLYHDGHEAYITDIPSPLKWHMPDHQKIEGKVEAAFREWVGLPIDKSKEARVTDRAAAMIEGWQLLPETVTAHWTGFDDEVISVAQEYNNTGEVWDLGLDPVSARTLFINRHVEIQKQTGES